MNVKRMSVFRGQAHVDVLARAMAVPAWQLESDGSSFGGFCDELDHGSVLQVSRRGGAALSTVAVAVVGGADASGGCSNHVADVIRTGRIGKHHLF